MKYSDPDGREDEDLSNLKKQATQDLLVLKDNLNSLLNEIDSENLSEGLKFAAKNNLGLDITNETDLSVLKHDIGAIKETADNIDDQNLVITPPLKEHPFWKMYVNKNDETHKINITKLSSLDRNLDPALFHEMTHFLIHLEQKIITILRLMYLQKFLNKNDLKLLNVGHSFTVHILEGKK